MGLMDENFQFSELSKKYKGFSVPAAKLKIEGKELLGVSGISVEQIQIKLSLNSAGSAVFTMNSCYDYKNSSFLNELKSSAVLGKTVEAELGYGSSTELIFKGFIVSVNMAFDVEAGIAFHVTAMDARRLMMSDNNHSAEYKEKKYSDIVTKILKRYEPLCSAQVEATQEELSQPVGQESSDYDFIANKLAQKDGMEFFVVGDKAYFRKKASNKSPVISLGIGMGLRSFERGAVYLDREIEVQGYSTDHSKNIVGKAKAKGFDQQKKVLSEPGLTVVKKTDIDSEQGAKMEAEAKARELQDENFRASGSCIGLPQIVPGRYIQIEQVDPLMNRKYYVTEVSHTIGRDGFVTSFETNGWE